MSDAMIPGFVLFCIKMRRSLLRQLYITDPYMFTETEFLQTWNGLTQTERWSYQRMETRSTKNKGIPDVIYI